jgi:hypothetical protein
MRRISFPLKPIPTACLLLAVGLILATFALRPTKAQDVPPQQLAAPTEVIDQVMNLIAQGRIDDGVALMEGVRSDPDLRQATRSRLSRLHAELGDYHGYDIASTQRFTNQFEVVDVMANYEQQPVLLRFTFYRPQNQDGVKWVVLGFQINTALPEIADILKDTPVEYVVRRR